MKILKKISKVRADLAVAIVIPSYREPELEKALDSLDRSRKAAGVRSEVIVVINQGEEVDQAAEDIHRENWESLSRRRLRDPELQVLWVKNVPQKKSGVGFARKTGMDLAAERLISAGNPSGAICCLDADAEVSENYISAICRAFGEHSNMAAASIAFEHRLDECQGALKTAIIAYETHLRLFIDGQRWAGHPHAIQTVGSSMAVRGEDYLLQGGMNSRKAGEDFYFLQKYIELGRCFELTDARVYPSGRSSDRVPFGTGKSVGNFLETGCQLTYHPASYRLLRDLVASVPQLYKSSDLPEYSPELKRWMKTTDFETALQDARKHTASPAAFEKRFFRWFNAFRVMKMFHYLRNYHPDLPVGEALKDMFEWFELSPDPDPAVNLQQLRDYDYGQAGQAFSS